MNLTNTTSNTIISGTSENDSIINMGNNVTINLGDGDDTLFNGLENEKANNVLINTGEGNNNVTVQAVSENVTIVGGNGNNRLESVSPKTLIIAGNGKNSLTFYTGSDNGTIVGGTGDEVINAVGHNVTINGGAGNDTIRTFRNAFDITMKGGAGDDKIIVSGDTGGNINHNLIQYSQGEGNDTFAALTSNDTVQILDGEIINAGLNGNDVVMTISGGSTLTWLDTINKSIKIINSAGNLIETILAGDRVGDTIVNDTVITGTAGNDSIFNEGSRVTINGLAGNDSITSFGNNNIINTGEGNNWVSVASAGSHVTINTGDGDNIVRTDENGTANLINFGNGQNSFVGSDSYNTLIGGSGGEGITLHNGSANSYVDAGDGSDTIAVGHKNITVYGGEGGDVINLFRDAENSIINAGKGNDTITVYNNVHSQTYQYAVGDGNDIISGFDSNDSIQILGGATASSVINGNNILVSVEGGSINLIGAAKKWSKSGDNFIFTGYARNMLTGQVAVGKNSTVTLKGGNLTDSDNNNVPDGVSIGAVMYIPESGTHTNIQHLSGNVTYNDTVLGVEGDNDYNIEAISPIDLSEKFPGNTYITDPNVTAIRNMSTGATISPRGTAGSLTAADWYSVDSDSNVVFLDGSYCVYSENQFSSRNYTKLSISNNNKGVNVQTVNDSISVIGGLNAGYAITLQSGKNISDKVTFKTDGSSGTIVVQSTANSGKYSLSADSSEFITQEYNIAGGDKEFTLTFGSNGSVTGFENFEGNIQTTDKSIYYDSWTTVSSGTYAYKGNSTNNPSKVGTFTISGSEISPSELSFTRKMYINENTGIRFALYGLSDEVTLNGQNLGVKGDDDYSVHFAAENSGKLGEVVVEDITTGATIDNNATKVMVDKTSNVTFTAGDYKILTHSYFRALDFTDISSTSNFTLNSANEEFSMELASGGTTTILPAGNFIDSTVRGDEFIINHSSGGKIKDFKYLTKELNGGDGTMIIINDLSGETTINGDDIGITGDDNYKVHYTANYLKEIRGVSTGASLKNNDNLLNEYMTDDNANIHVGKGSFNWINESTLYQVLPVKITTNNEVDIVTKDGKLTTIGGLTDGYNLSMSDYTADYLPELPSAFDEITFKSNGGSGTLQFGSSTYTLSGDNAFTFKFDSTGEVAELNNFDGKISGSGSLKINGSTVKLSDTLKSTDIIADIRRGAVTVDGSETFTDIFGKRTVVNAAGSNKNVKGNGILVAYGKKATLTGGSGNDLLLTKATNSTLIGGDGADTFMGGVGLTKTIIKDYNEDEDIVFHGQSFDTVKLNGEISGKNYTFYVNNRQIVVKNGANQSIKVVDVNGEVRYFGNCLTLDNNDTGTVRAQSNVVTIDAALMTKDVAVVGNATANKIISGQSTTTMTGGKGADEFIVSGQNLITDYTEEDVINVGNDKVQSVQLKGMNMILSLNEGEITLKGGKGKDIRVIESGVEKIYPTVQSGLKYNATMTKLTIGSNFRGESVDLTNYLPTVKNVTAIKVNSSVEIVGNDKNNSLIGGKGNDTLNGGAGNDTLKGGSGADVFIYTGGRDVIADYREEDSIQISNGTIESSVVSGNNVRLTTDLGNLIIKGAKNRSITVSDMNGSRVLNDFEERMSSENDLDNILEVKSSEGIYVEEKNPFEIETVDPKLVVNTNKENKK